MTTPREKEGNGSKTRKEGGAPMSTKKGMEMIIKLGEGWAMEKQRKRGGDGNKTGRKGLQW